MFVGGRGETLAWPKFIDSHEQHHFSSPEMPDTNQHPPSQRKTATVLFADLSGFTAMSANLDPEEVRDVVNRYFEALATAVRRYEGSIDKYIGDCLMAVFGVPATRENDAERACRAALDMLLAVRELASGFGSGAQPPDIHIGINTGLVVAAPMGSGDSAQFTVMGDTVNLASRLCHEAENGTDCRGGKHQGLGRARLRLCSQRTALDKRQGGEGSRFFSSGAFAKG